MFILIWFLALIILSVTDAVCLRYGRVWIGAVVLLASVTMWLASVVGVIKGMPDPYPIKAYSFDSYLLCVMTFLYMIIAVSRRDDPSHHKGKSGVTPE